MRQIALQAPKVCEPLQLRTRFRMGACGGSKQEFIEQADRGRRQTQFSERAMAYTNAAFNLVPKAKTLWRLGLAGQFIWWANCIFSLSSRTGIFLTVFCAGLLVLGLVAEWYAQRLVRQRLREVGADWCTKCGYWRRGLADETPCPECGAAFDRAVTEALVHAYGICSSDEPLIPHEEAGRDWRRCR